MKTKLLSLLLLSLSLTIIPSALSNDFSISPLVVDHPSQPGVKDIYIDCSDLCAPKNPTVLLCSFTVNKGDYIIFYTDPLKYFDIFPFYHIQGDQEEKNCLTNVFNNAADMYYKSGLVKICLSFTYKATDIGQNIIKYTLYTNNDYDNETASDIYCIVNVQEAPEASKSDSPVTTTPAEVVTTSAQ